MILPILIGFSLLASLSYADNVFNYCVGDLSSPTGPSGYTCKDPSKVSADDFIFTGLRVAGNTTNTFKFGASPAFAPQFPALNGMGISMVRADLGVGGAVPIHTHRVAELLILVKGTVIGGFIDTNNRAFYKTLHEGT
ncbi:Auxin-binding protein ABP19b [Bienertia sinuspersici]